MSKIKYEIIMDIEKGNFFNHDIYDENDKKTFRYLKTTNHKIFGCNDLLDYIYRFVNGLRDVQFDIISSQNNETLYGIIQTTHKGSTSLVPYTKHDSSEHILYTFCTSNNNRRATTYSECMSTIVSGTQMLCRSSIIFTYDTLYDYDVKLKIYRE